MSSDPIKSRKRLDDLITMRSLVHPKYLSKEAELMTVKWFNYRFMSPLEATMLFAKKYTTAVRRYVRTNFDVALANSVNGVRPWVPSKREGWFTQLWEARQRADELFVPYEVFFAFAFEFAGNRQRKWTPLPIQLHASTNTAEAWWSLFRPFAIHHLAVKRHELSALSQYRLEHDRGLHAQHELREVMAEQIKFGSGSPVDDVCKVSVVNRHLRASECIALLPEDIRADIRNRVRQEVVSRRCIPTPKVQLDDEDLHISCFGVHESINPGSTPCNTCPLYDECVAAANLAMVETTRRTGSGSPIDEADKERNRKNVAACRARQRTKAAGSLSSTASSP